MSQPYGERWAPWRVWTGRVLAALIGVGSVLAGVTTRPADWVNIIVGVVLISCLLVELAVAKSRISKARGH